MTERAYNLAGLLVAFMFAVLGVLAMIHGSGFVDFVGTFMAMTAVLSVFRA